MGSARACPAWPTARPPPAPGAPAPGEHTASSSGLDQAHGRRHSMHKRCLQLAPTPCQVHQRLISTELAHAGSHRHAWTAPEAFRRHCQLAHLLSQAPQRPYETFRVESQKISILLTQQMRRHVRSYQGHASNEASRIFMKLSCGPATRAQKLMAPRHGAVHEAAYVPMMPAQAPSMHC